MSMNLEIPEYGIDIIGDIHGYAQELRCLLQELGYSEKSGSYRHREGHRVLFLGDFIDRGPQILGTLESLKRRSRSF